MVPKDDHMEGDDEEIKQNEEESNFIHLNKRRRKE
jgi:hypothetical protein